MADDSAASRTFGVIELLEMVLVNFDIKEVTKLKRVCKQWNEVIATSKQLRQICFLEPAEPTRMAVGTLKDFSNLSGVEILSPAKMHVPEKCCLAIAQQHPALKLPDPDICYFESEMKEFCSNYTFDHEDIQELQSQGPELDNVLVAQPPFHNVSTSNDDGGEWHRYREENGFTFGKLRKVVLEQWRDPHDRYNAMLLDVRGTLLDSLIQLVSDQTDTHG